MVIPELTIDEPAYRISVAGNSVGLNGHAEVLTMYPRRGRDPARTS